VVEFPLLSSDIDETSYVFLNGSSINDTGDRASVVDFIEHLVFTRDITVFLGLVDGIAFRDFTDTLFITDTALDSFVTGSTIFPTLSLVVGARFISDTVLVHIFEGTRSTTTVATRVTRAGKDDLRGDNNIGSSSISHNLDPVGESGGTTKSVATTAVLRNVMVSHDSKIVLTVDIVPEEVSGDLILSLVSGRVDNIFDDVMRISVNELLHREQREKNEGDKD
jgi:hypothetical protein